MALATVGASLVLLIVIRNVSDTEAPASSNAVTATSRLPTSALVGVPDSTRVSALKVNQLGNADPSVLEKNATRESPTSGSTNVFVRNVNENRVSSVAVWSAIGFATVGASLVLATTMSNVSLAVALLPSVAVTVIETVPTFAFSGVPENVRVPALKLNQPGKLLVV